MNLGLQGKVAIVLAASKGLGRASALALAQEGAFVTVGSRDSSTLEKTAQDIRQETNSRVLAVPVDVTKEEDLWAIVDKTIQEFGRIDILVNNAGGPPAGKFDAFDDSQWQAAFELTLLSTIRVIRLVLPHMRQAGSGRIINIVSTSVKQPIPDLLLSNVLRPGVIGLAKSLSFELAAEQITINNVCPGRVLTDRITGGPAFKQMLAQGMSDEQILKMIAQDIPMKRLGRPEELAALVTFLASQQAAYITGTTTQVDGGLVQAMF